MKTLKEADEICNEGEEALQKGDYKLAEELFGRAARRSPTCRTAQIKYARFNLAAPWAEQCLCKEAEKGDSEARVGLSDWYIERHKDYDEAIRWYRKAADADDADAACRMGGLYQSGRGIERPDKRQAA